MFAGIGQFLIGCSFASQFTAIGYIVLVVFEACFIAVAFALAPRAKGRYLALAGLLTLGEYAREHLPFGGLPIGGIALGQAGSPLAPLARLGGPILVTGATYLAGIGLCAFARAAYLYQHKKRHNKTDARLLRGEFASGCVAAFVVVGAVLFAHVAPNGGAPGRTVSAAIVQGGGVRGLNQFDVPATTVFAAQITPTEELSGPVNLVIWPEDTIKLATSLSHAAITSLIGAQAARLHATLLAGVTVNVGSTRFLNEIVAWGPTGSIIASVEKVHAVPFGEYVPARSFFAHFVSLSAVSRDAIIGYGNGEMTTPVAKLAIMISYETFFSDRGRSGVRAGGQLLVVPTNTASYSSNEIPAQELAASRLQAISEGRYLLQAATTGYSALIDPFGRVVVQSSLGTQEVLRVKAPLLSAATDYERFGDGPTLFLCLVAIALGFGRALRARRRATRQQLN
jgi:apolipoprotein N-acyltransferase